MILIDGRVEKIGGDLAGNPLVVRGIRRLPRTPLQNCCLGLASLDPEVSPLSSTLAGVLVLLAPRMRPERTTQNRRLDWPPYCAFASAATGAKRASLVLRRDFRNRTGSAELRFTERRNVGETHGMAKRE
jgi:hypothetical protein